MEESLQLCHQPQRPPEDRISLAANIIALNLRRQLMARVPIWPDNLSGINPVGYIHAAAQISKFSYLSLSPPPHHMWQSGFLITVHIKKKSPDAFGFMLPWVMWACKKFFFWSFKSQSFVFSTRDIYYTFDYMAAFQSSMLAQKETWQNWGNGSWTKLLLKDSSQFSPYTYRSKKIP